MAFSKLYGIHPAKLMRLSFWRAFDTQRPDYHTVINVHEDMFIVNKIVDLGGKKAFNGNFGIELVRAGKSRVGEVKAAAG
jgi:hypothetical protein